MPARLGSARQTAPDPAQPSPADSDAVHSDAAHSDAAHSDAAHSHAAQTNAGQTDAARTGLARWAKPLSWLLHGWRRSLQLRVVTATIVLSALVVALVGALLLDQITEGVLKAKQRAAIAEAYGGFDSAQTQLSVPGLSGASVGLRLAEIVQTLQSRSTENAQFEILALSSGTPAEGGSSLSNRITGSVDPVSVERLRKEVAEQELPHLMYEPIVYDKNVKPTERALIIGARVGGSAVGFYEMYYLFPLKQEAATLALVQRTLLSGGAILLALIGVIAWFVVRQTVTPVRMAARIAERLAAGELHERLEVRGEDDLARLAVSFNEMAASLADQIDKLKDLSLIQRRFVSDVSHELRTPLTTVRMAADFLHDARPDFDRDTARSAELLQRELDRFEELLGELLEISRFDAGAADLEAEPVDLRRLVHRVVSDTSTLAARTGSDVRLRLPSSPCVAEVDQRRVDRILRNLVVNALEHGEGRPVDISVGTDDDGVAIAVRDFGVGLRPGEADQVFNRFWRGDPARARTTGGTGLGLSIALEDARLHGGWLQAWGRPGEGSVFRLTVPRQRDATLTRSPLPLTPRRARHAEDPAGRNSHAEDPAGRNAQAGAEPVPPPTDVLDATGARGG